MKNEEKTHSFRHEQIITQTSMCAPGCRMVDVSCSLYGENNDEKNTVVSEVVAIRTDHFELFSKKYRWGTWPATPLTREEFDAEGWTFDGRETEIVAIIHDEEYGLIGADNSLLSTDWTAHRLLVIPPVTDVAAFVQMVEKTAALLYAGLQEKLNKNKKAT